MPMEVLGTYDPIPKLPAGTTEGEVDEKGKKVRKVKDIKVDVARAKYWLGVGAQPSDTVWRLLSMVSTRGTQRGGRSGRSGRTKEL